MTAATREQALYLPQPILDVLLREAARRERSVSWCLQRAWTLARERVRELGPERTPDEENDSSETAAKQRRTLLFPESMLQEIREEAARLDTSLSFIVCRAWRLAAPELLSEAHPS